MNKNIHISNKIKQIRELLKQTQAEFASNCGVSQRDISFLEQGQRENIPPSVIRYIQNMNIDLNWLYSNDNCYPILLPKLLPNNAYSIKEDVLSVVNEDEVKYETKLQQRFSKLRSIEEEYYSRNNILFVSERVTAGFLEGFGDPEYEQELPRFSLPGLVRGTFYAFLIQGDSMYPTYTNGDVVITEHVPKLEYIKPKECYVMSTFSEGLCLKRLALVKDSDTVLCVSDNQFYPPYEAPLSDLSAIFRIISFISSNTGPRNVEYITLLDKIMVLEDTIKGLKGS